MHKPQDMQRIKFKLNDPTNTSPVQFKVQADYAHQSKRMIARMVGFPLKVKRRDSSGRVAEVLCDTIRQATDDVKHFRDMGYTDVWIEDYEGRRMEERDLKI